MALTDDEAQRLREIESGLLRDDPRLVRRLASMRAPRSFLLRRGITVLAISFVALVTASALQFAVLYISAWVGLLVGTALVLAHYSASTGEIR
jgi:hypothetical protein